MALTFGVCAAPEEGPAILDAGFDYIEVPANGFGGFEAQWDPSPYSGLPTPTTNLFFDSSLTLHERGREPYDSYIRRTIERAATLGVETMVVGSGRARRTRPDESPEDGMARFVDAVDELQTIATPHGIRIAPESLNREETNVGTSLGELALALHGRGLGYTADSYHVLREWDLDGQGENVKFLWDREILWAPTHVHLGPLSRGMPDAEDPQLVSFVREVVRRMGYEGRVSLEVHRGADFDFVAANRTVRALFAPALVARGPGRLRQTVRNGVLVDNWSDD